MHAMALSFTSWSMSAAFSRTNVHSYKRETNGTNSKEHGWSVKVNQNILLQNVHWFLNTTSNFNGVLCIQSMIL